MATVSPPRHYQSPPPLPELGKIKLSNHQEFQVAKPLLTNLSRTVSPAPRGPVKVSVDTFKATILRSVIRMKDRLREIRDYLSTSDKSEIDSDSLLNDLKTVLVLVDKKKNENTGVDQNGVSAVQTIQIQLDEMWNEISEKDSISAILPLAKTIYRIRHYLDGPSTMSSHTGSEITLSTTTTTTEIPTIQVPPSHDLPLGGRMKDSLKKRDISLSTLLNIFGETNKTMSGSLRKFITNEVFHFVLTPKALSYYNTTQSTVAVKTIHIADITQVRALKSSDGYLIKLQTKNHKEYQFVADDEETRDQWVTAIANHCTSCTSPRFQRSISSEETKL